MNELEKQLQAAFRARADLVQPEDLSPRSLPLATPGAWWRRPGTYLLVAAVLVILALVPALAGLPGENSRGPQPAQTPSTGSSVQEDPWRAVDARSADIDGDGVEDEVRVVARGAGDLTYRVEVEFANGATRTWAAGSDRATLHDPVNLDRQIAGAEMLVEVGADPANLVVLGVGTSRRLDVIMDGRIRAGVGPEDFRYHWWLHEGGIRMTASLQAVPEDAEAYAVRMADWTFAERGVTRHPRGEFCVAADAPETLTPLGDCR